MSQLTAAGRANAAAAAGVTSEAHSSKAAPAAATATAASTVADTEAALTLARRIANKDANYIWSDMMQAQQAQSSGIRFERVPLILLVLHCAVRIVHAVRFIVLPLGFALRFLLSYLLHLQHLHGSLSARSELTSALVSFPALRESITNVQVAGVSPYAGLSSSHAPPLLIALFSSLLTAPSMGSVRLTGAAAFWCSENLALVALWSLVDAAVALALFGIARDFHARCPSPSAPLIWVSELTRGNAVVRHAALVAAGVYMLNPVTLLSAAIFNLSHFTHLAVALALLAATRGRAATTGVFVGLAVYLDLYPLVALAPTMILLHRARFADQPDRYPQYRIDRFIRHDLCTFIEEGNADAQEQSADPLSDQSRARIQRQATLAPRRVLKIVYQPVSLPVGAEGEEEDGQDGVLEGEGASKKGPRRPIPSDAALGIVDMPAARWNVLFIAWSCLWFILSLGALFLASFVVCGGDLSNVSELTDVSLWVSLFDGSYGYVVRVPSLSGTYGIFWYFFTSIFDRFHGFFLVIFHAHVLVYLVPLSLRLRDEPLFLVSLLLHLTQVFRAYPTLPGLLFGALGLLLLNLPTILLTVRRAYLVVFLALVSLVTQALMRFLWLVSGSGNANFLYFQHTLFVFSHLLGVLETLGAIRRRQATVMEGQCQETIARRKQARSNTDKSDDSSSSCSNGTGNESKPASASTDQESKKHA